MRRRRDGRGRGLLQPVIFAALLALGILTALPLQAAILPDNFFDQVPPAAEGAAAIAADVLEYDIDSGWVRARGNVGLAYGGYLTLSDELLFDQNTNDVVLSGNVYVKAPDGTEISLDSMVLEGGLKIAVLRSLVMLTPEGELITAATMDREGEFHTVLTQGSYAPCGECVDAKGRRIGWRVRAKTIVHHADQKLVYLEEPVLELLGLPVAWMPFLWIPDPTDAYRAGFRVPSYLYSDRIGHMLTVPIFMSLSQSTSVLFYPSLISRQGVLVGGRLTHLFDTGAVSLDASGIYQLDRSPFVGLPGDRDLRGAVRTVGELKPLEHFRAGWSYTSFTDPGYLPDYQLASGSTINQAYVEYLTSDTYADVRVQEFVRLGDITPAMQAQQATALPRVRIDHMAELPAGFGQFRTSARLLGVQRGADATTASSGVPYNFGFQGQSYHGTIEAAWTDQLIMPGGFVVTPYLAIRGDAASYNGASALMPTASTLLAATPIAALDVRYPFMALSENGQHFIEPVAQIVYRGATTTAVGITNNNAQSLVLDDANIFSFNRFSGSDRQETGLRVNYGGHYMSQFEGGAWLDLTAGHSLFLAGTNAFTFADPAVTGAGSGLETASSYLVAGARMGIPGLTFGGKLQFDPNTARFTRAAAIASATLGMVTLSGDYTFRAANAAIGQITDQHDAGGRLAVTIEDYWTASAAVNWDIRLGQMTDHTLALQYDDGYLLYGLSYTATGPNALAPLSQNVLFSITLKGPRGKVVGSRVGVNQAGVSDFGLDL